MKRVTADDAFQADAFQTAKDIAELGVHIEGQYPGGAARCARASKLIWELAARDECETCGVVIGGEHDCATATPYIARLTADRDEAIAHAWDFENGNAYYRLQSRIATLERALRFYAEKENHLWQQKEHEDGERYTKASSLVDEDGGAIARAALTPDTPEDDR